MKFYIAICFVIAFLNQSFSQIDRQEALKAYEYLNKIRENPSKFSTELGVDLSKVNPANKLIWNDTLARVAEEKARDMATRNYFAHVNPDGKGINIMIHEAGYKLVDSWINDPANNYFESLSAGSPTGVEGIMNLVIDEGVPGYGHRKHLLGISDFYANLTDIGIGFFKASNSPYISYMCVIIAKRNW